MPIACPKCGNMIKSAYYLKKYNGEKMCSGCYFRKYHEDNPNYYVEHYTRPRRINVGNKEVSI